MIGSSQPQPPPKENVSDFREGLRGQVLLPGEEGYDETRTIWNATIDKHPAVIARCEGAADVATPVTFAREPDLPLAVKGGGHSVAGNALVDDGLVVDLSPMDGVRVDPEEQTARVGPRGRHRRPRPRGPGHGLATPAGFNSETGEEDFAYRGNDDRLAELKAKYNPENVFQGNQNIEPSS